MIRVPALACGLAVAILCVPDMPACPQDVAQSPTQIVLRPAAEPVPALKYRLLPERGTLVPGNAAVFYHRAIELLAGKFGATEEHVADGWITGPLESIPRDQAHQWLEKFRTALVETRLGARRQTCNWEFDLRTEGFELLVPEIQNSRTLIRLVAVKARLAVLEGKIDEAVEWLQTGFAMARHVSEGPVLIQGLIGGAMCTFMTKPLEDLIQAPAAPSLFWALADRPRPFVDVAEAMEGERFLLEREIPMFRELDAPPWSLEKSRSFAEELRKKLFRLAGYSARSHSGPEASGVEEWSSKLGLAAMVAQAFPEAKRALIARGRAASQVEAMPAVQVAALQAYQLYQQLRDDEFKWLSLPFYQALKGVKEASRRRYQCAQSDLLLKLFQTMAPANQPAHMSQVLVDRRFDAIQCVEAIRIYGAAHGKFPAGLEDISEAPVPLDLATGKPFGYRVQGDHAILSAPSLPGEPNIPQYTIKYDLKWSG